MTRGRTEGAMHPGGGPETKAGELTPRGGTVEALQLPASYLTGFSVNDSWRPAAPQTYCDVLSYKHVTQSATNFLNSF